MASPFQHIKNNITFNFTPNKTKQKEKKTSLELAAIQTLMRFILKVWIYLYILL